MSYGHGRVRRRVQYLILISLSFLAFATSCQWEQKRPPSFLIIAIDSLSSDQISCTDLETGGDGESGFQALCSESVRFTHAYTPSVLTQPALTSLLTARWPHQHGVANNGRDFLAGRERTLAEIALSKGYRTALVSGGPPIWKKSALDQGFEVFEDSIAVTKNRFYRSTRESGEIFLNWLRREASDGDSFLGVVYLSDLQIFDYHGTGPETGPTETTYEGRLDYMDKELGNLFQEMKSLNRWNDTYVLLVGLNGRPRFDRSGELDGYNLLSENSQVGLLIKPIQEKKRDLAIQWKVDNNVTLVDVAATVFDLLGEKAPSDGPFQHVSLANTLVSPIASWDPDRPILIQSGWSDWHEVGRLRIGIRKGHGFFLHEFPPKIYNSLLDRMETSPITPSHSRWAEAVKGFAAQTAELKTTAWVAPGFEILRKVQYARALWSRSNPVSPDVYLDHILSGRKTDQQSLGWFALSLIEKGDWNGLGKLGKKTGHQGWMYLSSQHLKSKAEPVQTECFKIWSRRNAKDFNLQSLKTCEDPVSRDLISWVHLSQSSEANYHRDTFIKNYQQLLTDRRIGQLNYVNGLLWDVPQSSPGGPTEGELLLYLPENQKFLEQANEKSREI